MKLTRHLAVAFAVLAICLAAAFASFIWNSKTPAPAISFIKLDGTPGTIAELQGKVVLVNFWATSCSVCVKEMPQMMALHHKFSARGYETLAVSMSYDAPASVIDFIESRHLPFTVVIDNVGAVARGFGDVSATPTSVLINKRGEIVQRFVGQPDFAALNQQIEQLLNEA